MRDRDALKRIKDAKDYCESIGKPVKISLLANEGCWGGCPIMPEHYQFNCTRSGMDHNILMILSVEFLVLHGSMKILLLH